MKHPKWILSCCLLMWAGVVASQAVVFPNMQRTWSNTGTFIGTDELRQMGEDMTPTQVRGLVGQPFFQESDEMARWNYLFNFKTPAGDYLSCPFQVVFEQKRLRGMFWKDKVCADFMSGFGWLLNETHVVSLSVDDLFVSGTAQLKADTESLAQVVAQMKSGYRSIKSIEVLGHLDEGVAVDASWSLSLAQANAIKSYLAAQGFDERVIVAQGMSSSKPVLSCYGLTAAALTNCRSTNRRIEVMVNGDF